jgi:adenylate kinase family enzyme
MERIMIIGCGGAGKSTLARSLGEKTGLPVIHLDKLFWKPGWVSLSREEFDLLHQGAIEQEKWIIDGNFDRTMAQRMDRCDAVIYLDFSRWACVKGVLKRIITTYGTVRPDMGEGCPERFSLEFLVWVWNFNKNKRENIYNLLNQHPDKEVHILKNRRSARKFLANL